MVWKSGYGAAADVGDGEAVAVLDESCGGRSGAVDDYGNWVLRAGECSAPA